MAFIFSKKWREERDRKAREQLKNDAMEKMRKADLASRNDKEARREACVAAMKALVRGVELDPEDPIFQRFHEKNWFREMGRVSKTPIDARAELERTFAKFGIGCASPLTLTGFGLKIGAKFGPHGLLVGGAIGFLAGLLVAPKLEKFCTKLTTDASDKWEDFYDQIPDNRGKSSLTKENGRSRGKQLDKESLKKFLDERYGDKPVIPLPLKRKFPEWWWKLRRNMENRRGNSDQKAA